MYFNGKGVTQNYAKSFKWSQLAANQGCAQALANPGRRYVNGQGVSRDLIKTIECFQLAAK